MIQSAAQAVFDFSKRHFNRLDRFLAEWEYRLTHQEFDLRPRTGRGRLPPLPGQVDSSQSADQLLNYDRAAFADRRLRVKARFWSLGLRQRLLAFARRGLFRLRLIGSRLYLKLIDR